MASDEIRKRFFKGFRPSYDNNNNNSSNNNNQIKDNYNNNNIQLEKGDEKTTTAWSYYNDKVFYS